MESELLMTRDGYRKPVGLGGWLILVQLQLFFTLILCVVNLVLVFMNMYGSETWKGIFSTDPVSVIIDIIYTSVCIFICVFILIKFYKKKKIVPILMIAFYVGIIILRGLEIVILQQLPMAMDEEIDDSLRHLIRSTLNALIWVPYFLRSIRVKNTFRR